jgi:hypothetical protein
MTRSACHVAANRQPILRELGLDADTVFTHPDIQTWRKLPDRENATLDAILAADGQAIRLHVKRYPPARHKSSPAEREARGIQLLQRAGIATVPLVAWGHDATGRSFLITQDLGGLHPLDKLIADGLDFETVLTATADLAAILHNAGLHHRDLYLCHFFGRPDDPAAPLALIDAARVRPLPRLFKTRWIVKDLAQFRYSAQQLHVPEALLDEWLERYTSRRSLGNAGFLRRRILQKTAWIARHDARLVSRQPQRNISIP